MNHGLRGEVYSAWWCSRSSKPLWGRQSPGWVRFPYASAILLPPSVHRLKTVAKDEQAKLRSLPSLSAVLSSVGGKALADRHGIGFLTSSARHLIAKAREALRSGAFQEAPTLEQILRDTEYALERLGTPTGRRVINATGILLHTGLGRAPLSDSAMAAVQGMNRYSSLEVTIETGARSRREERVESLLQELTGCEAATVVNNNAAATFLILHAMATGREVIISRGQLIEIGGSFRMPDVMAQSGAILREVGSTNKTHVSDYERAIGPLTGALMHVHTSNYRIRGFSSMPKIDELVALGKKHGIKVIDDLGSGAFKRLSPYGLSDESMVRDSLEAGADVVCFSGDKLISGPQCGIICGRKESVATMRKNPFFRMFRVDKMTLAGLEATLIQFLNDDPKIPLYEMLARSLDELLASAERIVAAVVLPPAFRLDIVDDSSYMGGGTLPDEAIPSKLVRLTADGTFDPEQISTSLRIGLPSVFARVSQNAVLFDCRTLLGDDEQILAERISAVLQESAK